MSIKHLNGNGGRDFTEAKTSAMDSAKALVQLAFDNTQSITAINFELIEAAIAYAQNKAIKMMVKNENQSVVEYFQDESPTAVMSQVVAFQAKLAEVLRKNNEFFMLMANDAIEKTQSEFKKLAIEAVAKAPSGSEAFAAAFSEAFDAGLQKLHEDRIAKQHAYANLQRIVDITFTATEAQLAAKQKQPLHSNTGNGVSSPHSVHA
jgi:hypothetical protein